MKHFILSLQMVFVLNFGLQAQYLDFQNSVYYTANGNALTSSLRSLSDFNYNTANPSHPLLNDGVYYPVKDYVGDNIWVRVRHVAADPNGTSVGVFVSATAGSPFRMGGFGGWAGFKYQFDIYRDANLTSTPANILAGLFPTNVTVESIETLSVGELVSFEIINGESSPWSLNSINFTGNNPTSNPGFSSVNIPWNSSRTGFSPSFPPASKNIYVIDYGSGSYYAEFKMSADTISQFNYGYEYTGGSSGYQGMRMAFGIPSTLPIRITGFTGFQNGDYMKLNWTTAQQINVSRFEIQKSVDGSVFKTIAFKDVSAGNTYSWDDNDVTTALNYYRLKIIDFDGSFSYSNVLKLKTNKYVSSTVSIYANTVKDILRINSSKVQQVTLIDMQGRVLDSRILNKGINLLNIENLSTGIYFLNVPDEPILKFYKCY